MSFCSQYGHIYDEYDLEADLEAESEHIEEADEDEPTGLFFDAPEPDGDDAGLEQKGDLDYDRMVEMEVQQYFERQDADAQSATIGPFEPPVIRKPAQPCAQWPLFTMQGAA